MDYPVAINQGQIQLDEQHPRHRLIDPLFTDALLRAQSAYPEWKVELLDDRETLGFTPVDPGSSVNIIFCRQIVCCFDLYGLISALEGTPVMVVPNIIIVNPFVTPEAAGFTQTTINLALAIRERFR